VAIAIKVAMTRVFLIDKLLLFAPGRAFCVLLRKNEYTYSQGCKQRGGLR